MKLYFSPGACSLSPHIALREAGLAFDAEQVSLSTKQTKGGKDFREINPKGYVPALELDDGTLLTEGPAIVQYVADQKPETKLAPPAGTLERYRLQEWLNFISTEIHKNFSPLFNPKLADAEKDAKRQQIAGRLDYTAKKLEGKDFLLGDTFTVADGYLFTVLGWTRYTGIDLGKWPVLAAYVERIAKRPAVQAALAAEGLPK